MTPDNLKAVYREHISDGFLLDWYSLIQKAYPEAYKYAYGTYLPRQAHDVLGIHRRAIIEESLIDIVRRHPGMSVHERKNKKNSHNYVEVRAGRVVMTESALPYRNVPLRPADFRNQYALTLQHTLREIREDLVIEDGAVFAALIHGPQMNEQLQLDWSQCGFLFVGFPSMKCRSWLATIDLVPEFGVRAATRSVEAEKIEDQLKPRIRRDKETGTGS